MSTNNTQPKDRLPTSGPATENYDRYRSVATEADTLLIYDQEVGEAWIKSSVTVTLDEWE